MVSWSYSSIKLFGQCPKKYYHLKVAKDFTEPITDKLTYGSEFHAAAERFVKEDIPLPERFSFAKRALEKLRSMRGTKLCEHRMGVTRDFHPCKFEAPEAWWRGIVDLAIIDDTKDKAYIIDYKTGRSAQYADKDQLELMALAVFAHFPFVKVVKAGLLFVVCNAFVTEQYVKDNKDDAWERWIREISKLEQTHVYGVWNPKPNNLCGWCPVKICEHNRG
jgi:CRISPR/Cas system-associated exonuclease Cas4 (RecB family)